jgi:PhnB protein
MHSALVVENGIQIMASDTPPNMPYNPGDNVSISLSGEDEAELKGYWDKLSLNAKISMPLNKASWGDTFGMLTDKFGIHWLANITGKKAL